MRVRVFRCALLFVCLIYVPAVVRAQDDACKDKTSFALWLPCRVEEAVKVRITQRNSTKQSEAPSASSNSSALIDTSSASDLAGVALNPAGLSGESSDKKATSMSATVSAYAFKAASAGRDPLDPTFYNANRDYRRLFFTLGFDYPEGQESNPNERAILFGIKYLPYDKRDASDPSHRDRISKITQDTKKFGGAYSRTSKRVQDYLLIVAKDAGKVPAAETIQQFVDDLESKWGAIYAAVGQAELATIDGFIANETDAFAGLKEDAMKAAEDVRTAPQLSLAYYGKQRKQSRPDEHKIEAIADLGFKRGDFTMNFAYQFIDNKVVKDIQGGTIALGAHFLLTRDELEGRMPWIFSVAVDGSWMTDMTPMYRGQAKLTIPLFQGVDLPLSVTVASRTDLINEKDIRGHLGFTFDLARIAQAFKGRLLGNK